MRTFLSRLATDGLPDGLALDREHRAVACLDLGEGLRVELEAHEPRRLWAADVGEAHLFQLLWRQDEGFDQLATDRSVVEVGPDAGLEHEVVDSGLQLIDFHYVALQVLDAR